MARTRSSGLRRACSASKRKIGVIARFGQHARLRAQAGKRDQLVAKFREVAEVQRDNPACELMFVSTARDEDDVVFLTEVWTSAAEHERARNSPEVQAWAADMPALVAGPPDVTAFTVEGGKGVA